MKKNKVMMIIFILIILSGCAGTQIVQQDIGPFPQNYRQLIKTYQSALLRNPESAHYEFLLGPFKDTFPIDGIFQQGWITIVRIIAKDYNDKYISVKKIFVIRNGFVVGSTIMRR